MIYYIVRQTGRENYAPAATVASPDLAAKKAKAFARVADNPYTVFKITEQEHGTYRPGDDYG